MSTRSQRYQPFAPNPYKIGAAVAQVLSFLTTLAFVRVLLRDMQPLSVFLIAAALEGVLSLMKNAIFRSRRNSGAVGVSAFCFDGVLNAGGLFPLMQRIGDTPTGQMFTTWLNLQAGASNTAAVILALVFGGLLSAAPWFLWRAGDDEEEVPKHDVR
jgi:hypothetical protein